MKSGDGGASAAVAEPEPTQAELEAEFNPNDKDNRYQRPWISLVVKETRDQLCNAATKIQASFRGHMARKQAPKEKAEEELSKELQKLDPKLQAEEEELDIDLSDPDLHKAATKIQASFRGHKVRKEADTKDQVTNEPSQ